AHTCANGPNVHARHELHPDTNPSGSGVRPAGLHRRGPGGHPAPQVECHSRSRERRTTVTLKIEVEVPYEEIASDKAGRYLARALVAIGYTTPNVLSCQFGETETVSGVAGSDLSA